MQRRDFLKMGVLGFSAACFPGSLLLPRPAYAALAQFDVTAERVERTAFNGSSVVIPFWQFTDTATGQALQINVLSGDTVVINLTNDLDVPVNFVVSGLMEDAPQCLPGATQRYTIEMPPTPGTFLFHDGQNEFTGRAMGLGGALVVTPADGVSRLYDGGLSFNRDHLVVLQEVDTRLNSALDSGQTYNIDDYEPNYFFVNNVAYSTSGGVELMMALGESVAIRLVNAGLINYPMHFHGYHVNVATRDRLIEQFIVDKDTVPVRPSEVVEVILPVGEQAGLYPLHSHYVPAVTNNGFYSGGGLIILNAA